MLKKGDFSAGGHQVWRSLYQYSTGGPEIFVFSLDCRQGDTILYVPSACHWILSKCTICVYKGSKNVDQTLEEVSH